MYVNHPRFFAFIPGPGNMVSALGDALASGFNVIVSLWLEAAGPTAIEEVITQWLASVCGLPKTGGGILVSGGSVANLTGLAVARHVMLDDRLDGAVVYCSDQAHASLRKALQLLGFSSEQVRVIPTDTHYRLQARQLEDALIKDRELGRRPFCIIANAGTTNTGAVDRAYCWTEYFGRISDFSLTINEKLSILSDKQPYDLYKLYKMYAPDSRMSFLTWSQLRQVILIRSDCLAIEKGQAVFSPTNLTINMNVKKAIQHTGVAAVQEVKMTLWYFNDAITLSQQAAAVTSMLLSPSDVQTLRVSPEAQEISTLMQMGMQS